MAGPRAPIGTLSQHAAAAAGLVRGMVPNIFARADSARARKTDEPIESESDSDSESSASSDASEIDEESKADGKDWAANLKAKKATSKKTAEGKPIKSAAITSPDFKAKSLDTKPGLKEAEVSESSASESDSESEDESDGDLEMELKDMNSRNADAKEQTKQETESDVDSNSESSADEPESAPDGAKVSGKTALASTNGVASEEESPSESESESASEDEQEARQNSKEKAPSASESDDESENEDEPEPPRKPKEKASTQGSGVAKEALNVKKVAPTKPSKQSSVNGTARSQEFVSKSDMSDSEDEDAAQPMAIEKTGAKTPVSMPREIVTQGFHLRKADEDVDAAAVAQAFKKAKAEGKQIWYFTAPKSVPIEVIQKHTIPFEKIHAGQPILAHEGADYTGHFEEAANHAIKVLIPGKTGTNYETLNEHVSQVFHITRVTRFNGDEKTQPTPAATAAPRPVVANAPRPQPKGLKARYQPFGVSNGGNGEVGLGQSSDSEEDVEMTQAPALLTNAVSDAKADTPKQAAKKRKLGDVEKGTPSQGDASITPAKKSKKARVDDSIKKGTEAVSTKAIRQTPIAPPPVPSVVAKAAASPAPAPSSSARKSKKDKGKKKDSASAENTGGSKKPVPAKVTPILPPAVPGVKSP
ncbi:DNA-directed RNA polymerase I subunit RPA34.5-domain-containing protein [Chaetomium strumarium]|uniref:DNA-directed RNA polymerase I subunit RPA34.5-domain-containing protein n=1 Tax=Chaetomium strumarium TaxID=1170767 RepID=A0AAJ0GTI1_9PEZI|nr:DNA-directed RNA polymerase I subunit RPA34.5-domain-containing protein [Chaetomium strumarium]